MEELAWLHVELQVDERADAFLYDQDINGDFPLYIVLMPDDGFEKVVQQCESFDVFYMTLHRSFWPDLLSELEKNKSLNTNWVNATIHFQCMKSASGRVQKFIVCELQHYEPFSDVATIKFDTRYFVDSVLEWDDDSK